MKKSKKPKKNPLYKAPDCIFTFYRSFIPSILTISVINGAFLKILCVKKTGNLLVLKEVLSQINTDSMTEDDGKVEQE